MHLLLYEAKGKKDDARLGLLREGLRRMGQDACAQAPWPAVTRRAPGGKPCFPAYPQIHFSLSHSGDYLACAFWNEEVGLDIQENRTRGSGEPPRLLRIANRFFSREEYQALAALVSPSGIPLARVPGRTISHASADGSCPADEKAPMANIPLEVLFYRLWTIKEAYLKYVGCGLSGDMRAFCPAPIPNARVPLPIRGKIRILDGSCGFLPAEYAILPAPHGYTMSVCGSCLPDFLPVPFLYKDP